MKKTSLLYLLSILLLAGCGLQKDIDVPLPGYEKKLVVECYLEPRQPYRLTLTESASYFDKPSLSLVEGATVVIKHKGNSDTLRYKPVIIDSIQKGYNYSSDRLAVADYNSDYELYIKDRQGRVVQGKTRFMSPVPIDTVEWKFSDDPKKDTLAYLLTRFKDTPRVKNYYRIVINKSSLNKFPESDFAFEDQLFDTNAAVGTSYKFKNRDTVFVTLYHIDRDYYEFQETVDQALNASGNPFGQPAVIKSTISGGIGVFVALSYYRKRSIIRK